MFFSNAIDPSLALTASIVCSLIVSFVFFRMFFSYTSKRQNKNYSQGRIKAPSIAIFNYISKLMFLSSMGLTLISYWMDFDLLLGFHSSLIIQLIGAAIVMIGYIKLNLSFNDLGDNYSPSFDAYLPSTMITDRNYKLIRHPIYLYNLFISFGLAISSGLAIVCINAIIGLIFILRIVQMEEAYLKKHFPDYINYTKKSWRLIPYCY